MIDTYFSTRKNKRYGRDAMAYELSWVSNLVRDFHERKERTFRVRHNYAFLTSVPRWREIFATSFEGRLADHEVCDILIPLADREISRRSFNNREGMGAQAAINQLIEDMTEVEGRPDADAVGATAAGWVIKLDLKGYFPSALWSYAERCLQGLIDKYGSEIAAEYGEEELDYLRWLTMIIVHANPAAHCELRTPWNFWPEHIEPEKSLFHKPEGEGAAIGRLVWQTAMGLYINDEIRWLTEECGLRVVCFVDDIVMVVPDRLEGYALSLIPELRKRLATKNIRLNEKKFYCQPIAHGLEFLGSHIRPLRVHLNNKTFGRCMTRMAEFNALQRREKYECLDAFVASVNSYTGLLKARTDYKRVLAVRDAIGGDWWRYIEWDARRQCVAYKPYYTPSTRLNRKYHLKIKRHDTIRTAAAA